MNGFDESEFDQEETAAAAASTTEEAATAFAEDLMSSDEDASDEESSESDDYMAEIDRCFEVASYYRQLLRAPLFRDANEIATTVEEEIRGFVRGRLGDLLNRPQEAPAPVVVHQRDFDDEQVNVLKAVADKLLKRGGEAPVAPPAKPAPSIAPVEAPPPAKPPRPVTPAAPPAPVVKPAPAPAPKPAAVAPAAPPRRPVGRPKKPAGAKPAPAKVEKPAAPEVPVTKTVVSENPITGEQREVTVPKVQNPAGRIPFRIVPNGGASVESAAAAHAALGVRDPNGMLAGVVAFATSRNE